jgi:hypothetical protein
MLYCLNHIVFGSTIIFVIISHRACILEESNMKYLFRFSLKFYQEFYFIRKKIIGALHRHI